MGLAFFDEQRKRGAVGEAAVRFEILMIIIMVLSFVSVIGNNGFAYGFTGLSVIIPLIGIYGAYHLKDPFLQFVIFTAIKIALCIIFVIFAVMLIVLLVAALSSGSDDDENEMTWNGSSNANGNTESVVIAGVVILMYVVGFVLSILSVVWAQRLRRLIRGQPIYFQNQPYQTLPPGPPIFYGSQQPPYPPPQQPPYPPPQQPYPNYQNVQDPYPPQQQHQEVPAYQQNPPPSQLV